ncbi:MAG: class I SAM-dependent methyltransferase [Verrucomicrobiae bacterium]|nr:class I SAM-dependent methyltransferase [Verrucomicrobiae bacterium]
MVKITKVECCRLCASTHWRLILPLHPTPVGDYYLPRDQHPEKLESYPLDLYQCAECGHVQLRAIVDPEYLYREYIYTTTSSLGLADHFKNYAKTVRDKLSLPAGSLIVEIGSNDGTMLRAFQELGFRVLGVDPAREIAARATASGIPTLNDFFTQDLAGKILADHGSAALIIANNVIANVPDPSEFVKGVRTLIGHRGVFVFETGYLRYLAEDVVFDNIYHEHIDYHSVTPLARFFKGLGMCLFDVDINESKGSSIRVHVQSAGGPWPVAHSVAEAIGHESAAGYATAEPYQKLSASLEMTKKRLHQLLHDGRAAGKKIAGYGASVGVTTVLYHLEIGGLIDYLIDDNPVRQGLYSPGLALPIRGPEVLLSPEKPEIVLILAWRYAAPIMSKNKSYTDRGGCFLKFLPKIEMIGSSHSPV